MNSGLSMNQALIEKLTNILEVNLDKESFGVKELAQEAGLSRSQLHRKLNILEHKSASRFIREFRLKKGMSLLQNDVATVSEIAYRVGFSSPAYFNSCFHDYYGYPPGEAKLKHSSTDALYEDEPISDLIDVKQNRLKKASIKKIVLGNKMVWINTFFILLLIVVSYKLYRNYYVADEVPVFNNRDKSIAILPFKNLSSEKENQYFADGMMDDILNQLSKIQEFSVKSRQSAEKYRDSDKSMVEIGKELGVNYLVEGSAQKHADSVRIIAQLIDAKTDKHVWSDNYDFEFKHIFAIQSTISKQIAHELNAALTADDIQKIEKQPTENIEAYKLYLKGRYFWHRRTEEGLNKGIEYFKQAIALDSTYVSAYAGLADSYYVMPFYFNGKYRDSLFKLSREYIKIALSIDKNNAEAHATLGSMLCYKDWKWEASEKELKLAIKLNPNYATAHQYYSELLQILGRTKEARTEMDKALDLNPYSWIMHTNSAQFYLDEGLFEKAILEANKALELDKNLLRPYTIIMASYTYLKKENEAMFWWEESVKLDANPDIELNKGIRNAFNKTGMRGFYTLVTDDWVKHNRSKINLFDMAKNFAYLGKTEKALEFLELAYERRDRALIGIKSEYAFKDLRHEPRFLAILNKLNLGDYE